MTNAIVLAGVHKSYGDFVLNDIHLELPVGQVMGLVGVNGAGKSTIFRILMGQVPPDAGYAEVCGHRLPEAHVAAKREIGYAADDMRLYKSQSLQWHMDLVRDAYDGWDSAYAADLLQRFDLRAGQKMAGFSHGQRVKAVLLLSLARHPRLLLLDEPTTGLDPVARSEVLDAIAQVLQDETRSVLFSSHNTRDVEQISDTIAFLHRGRLVAVDDKETFLDGWRRIICQGDWREEFATVPEIVAARQNGSIVELKVKDFTSDVTTQLQHLGLVVSAVDRMDLEDIFVTSIAAGGR